MKRKLISFDAFDKIQNESLSNAQSELENAEPFLAQALGVGDLSLKSYSTEDVLYESDNGTFVHANFIMKDGHVVFENVEELVVDEETEHTHAKELLSNLVDAVLEGEDKKADKVFEQYLTLPNYRRTIKESKEWRRVPVRDDEGKATGKYEKRKWESKPKSSESSSDTLSRVRGKKKEGKRLSQSEKDLRKKRRDKIKIPTMKGMKGNMKKMAEWGVMINNVYNYLDHKNLGPVLAETKVREDERGNVTAIALPNSKMRFESQLKDLKYKTTSAKEQVLRHNSHMLAEDIDFCKAVGELKRLNNMSDSSTLEESLETFVTTWPGVLYQTQEELAETVKTALETVRANNFDDRTCDFLAEGILRTAHDAYVDRVKTILRHAGVEKLQESEDHDEYEQFQQVVSNFYKALDESAKREMQVYVDLYEAIRQTHALAMNHGDEAAAVEAAQYLEDLGAVISLESNPDLDVVESAANWLAQIVETNLESGTWSVSNNVHVTVTGDHPRMAQNARQGYKPSADFQGDFNDPAPVSADGAWKMGKGGDGASEMRSNSWGNISKGSYPSLSNPYVPQPFGDYKIKGEKHVDADSDVLGHWQTGGDTWPELQNPYVPQAETPQTYKANKGREKDLVVDK